MSHSVAPFLEADDYGPSSLLSLVPASPRLTLVYTKPTALPLQFDALPRELRSRKQWVAWKQVARGGNWAKQPVTPVSPGRLALMNAPLTWNGADTARTYAERHQPKIAGIGYVFSGNDPYTGIDLDDCLDRDTGNIDPWAAQLIRDLDSYAEISPSGTGVKIVTKARLEGGGIRRARPDGIAGGTVEIYDQLRYFTLTGHRVAFAPATVRDGQERVSALYRSLTPRQAVSLHPAASLTPLIHLPLPDGEAAWQRAYSRLDARMLACAAGESVPRSDGTPYLSESERDAALLFAFMRAGLGDGECISAFLTTERAAMLRRRKGGDDLIARLWRDIAKVRAFYVPGMSHWDGVRYARIDPAVFAHSRELGPYGVAVMTVLASHANRQNESFPAQETVARFLRCDDEKVRDSIALLRDFRLITYTRRIGWQQVHRLMYSDDEPVHLSLPALARLKGQGVDIVSVYATIAGWRDCEQPYPSQTLIGECLGINRKRVNPAVGWLTANGLVTVAKTGPRGLLLYRVAEEKCQLSDIP